MKNYTLRLFARSTVWTTVEIEAESEEEARELAMESLNRNEIILDQSEFGAVEVEIEDEEEDVEPV
jgi:hypothetical protein